MHIPASRDYNIRHIISSATGNTADTKSWICPEGVHLVSVYVVGGGGGGEATPGTAGAAGGTIHAQQRVVPGETYTLVAGKGGIRGIYGSSTAASGEPSYFKHGSDNLLVGYGGGKGFYNSSSAAAGGSAELLRDPLENLGFDIMDGDDSAAAQGANGGANLWASGGLGSVGGGLPAGGGAGYRVGENSSGAAHGGNGGNGGVILEYSLDPMVTDYTPA